MDKRPVPSFSDSQAHELFQLAAKLENDLSRVISFKRTSDGIENGALWFVWVAYANDGEELGRSGKFRFTSANLGETVSGAAMTKALKNATS